MKSGLLVASDDGIQTEKWAAEKAERRLSKGGLPLKEDKDGGASLWKNRGAAILPQILEQIQMAAESDWTCLSSHPSPSL